MKRALTLAAVIAAGLSVPALAGDKAAVSNEKQAVATHSAELSVAANAEQARKLLLSQGYTNVSELTRDANGRWTGTATKGDATTVVAIAIPPKQPLGSSATN